MHLELTIKSDYLPDWGVKEGIRELVANARDAEVQFGAKASINYNSRNKTLSIENEGVTLPHEALLLGHTTKRDRTDTIGQFGEGIKGGILALLRSGAKVKVRSGAEVWVPAIERSDKFRADVLCFEIATGRQEKNRVDIEISPINAEAWDAIKEMFRFLQRPAKREIETPDGTLLLDPEQAHKVYVRGVLVETNTHLNEGYDLKNAKIDRDRKMIGFWDLRFTLRNIWHHAIAQDPDPALFETYYSRLEKNADDLRGIYKGCDHAQVPKDVAEKIAETFLAQHGRDAIPAETLAASKQVEHLGKKGVIVGESLGAALALKLGTVETVIKSLQEEVVEVYAWGDLSDVEKKNLEDAIDLVCHGHACQLADIEVVRFRSDLLGQWKHPRILLAKSILHDADETLATLVHECAHRMGGTDGEHAHVAHMEQIWSGIVRKLREGR